MKPPETHEPGVLKFRRLECMQCGAVLNAAASPDHPGEIASPGDHVICGKCGAVMIFGDDLRPRGMTDAEMDALTADHEAMDAIARSVLRVHLIRAQPVTDQVQ